MPDSRFHPAMPMMCAEMQMRTRVKHKLGRTITIGMGGDPNISVLNQFCQAHDTKNLFVMDASRFVSIGCQNPTLTIVALAVRSTDYVMQEMKAGSIGEIPNARCRMHDAASFRMHDAASFRMHNAADCLMWSRDFSPGGGAQALSALPPRSGVGTMRTRMVHCTANARDRSSNQDDTTVTIPARSSPVAAPRGNMTNRLPSALMS
jgi:hypothetical protein